MIIQYLFPFLRTHSSPVLPIAIAYCLLPIAYEVPIAYYYDSSQLKCDDP